MSEKQYRLNKWGTRLLRNNRPLFDWTTEGDDIVDLLNELNDENEQLKQGLNDDLELIGQLQEENKQLKQFKEDVFYKIDMHLRMLPTARDNEFNEENGDPSLYTGAIYMIETLKKELENE